MKRLRRMIVRVLLLGLALWLLLTIFDYTAGMPSRRRCLRIAAEMLAAQDRRA